MKDEENKEPEKQPIDMNTDEALEYVFGTELSEALKQESERLNCPEPDEPQH